jgi:hypothetical protein
MRTARPTPTAPAPSVTSDAPERGDAAGVSCDDVAVLRDQLARTRDDQWDQLRTLLLAYADHTPVRRVAVVGNAPLQPDAVRAAEIDAADLVIRANAVVLDEPGRPPTVGSRCHVVLLSRRTRLTPWALRDYRDRVYLVPQAGFVEYLPGDEVGLLLDTPFWPADLGAIPLPNTRHRLDLEARLLHRWIDDGSIRRLP